MKDLLNRNSDIENLIDIINGMTKNGGSCSFAIDGAWGCGKSWVLDKLERRLQGVGDDVDRVDLTKVKGNYFVFHYNAWENDYYEEPLISILTTVADKLYKLNLIENIAKNICRETIGNVLAFLNETISKLTGVDIAHTVKKIKNGQGNAQEFNDKFLIGKTVEGVRAQLKNLAESQMSNLADGDEKFPLIFIVDELDRCLPEYAIKVLERLHHVFNDIPRCVMILSIDKNQLNHTIQNIFGADVNKEAYLAKFIDFTVKLDEGSLDEQLFWQEFEDYKKCFCELYMASSYN
ncbi:MAG: KAP family NTPase, partial [Clostridiales bacterium]|nr:KAP family NTPase [Clostridiales bacterium]